MVCSRIGLVDHRLNWVSVQSPANTSSTATSGPWLGGEERNRVVFEKRNYPSTPVLQLERYILLHARSYRQMNFPNSAFLTCTRFSCTLYSNFLLENVTIFYYHDLLARKISSELIGFGREGLG